MGLFIPTKGQSQCIHLIEDWYGSGNKQDFVYSGPAGTGKTSIIPEIMRRLGLDNSEVLFVAFTGKAATVLMSKGFNANTIHGSFFEFVEDYKYDNDNHIMVKNGRPILQRKFKEKEKIDPRIKLIVIDEGWMVNEPFKNTIYKFGVPVIVMGDEHQLPPIFGTCPFTNHIDFRLWEITRQAEGNGIIKLATMLRNNEKLEWYMNFNNDAYVMPKSFLKDRHLLKANIVLCGRNRTRNDLNDKIRSLHGSFGKLPNVGDKLVCRKNNWNMELENIPLVNGTLGKVENPIIRSECRLSNGIYTIDFKPDYIDEFSDSYYEALPCDYEYLNQPCGDKTINPYNMGMKLEFGEALTVHLSQGSQFDNVVYYDEQIKNKEYTRRLRYTAITRAVKKAYMFV